MKEIWKDIKGYEGLYQVSNLGRVKSLGNGKSTNANTKEERIMKLRNKPYKSVKLSKNGEYKYPAVHRLVAIEFIPNPENKPQVNHIDGNKHNNRVDNLEWTTAKENIKHSLDNNLQNHHTSETYPHSKKVIWYDESGELIGEFFSIRDAANKTGNSRQNISNWCNGKHKNKTGQKWIFNE